MSMIELKSSLRRAPGSEHGIGMLEMTLLLGAMVILAAAVAPSLLRVLQDQRHEQVMDELKAIHTAVNGDESDKTFGFVGDIGRFPVQLTELVEAVDLQPFRISEETAVGYGWSGPYLNRGIGTEDWATDAWGNRYDIGAVGDGQVRSAGPNGKYDDDDDLVYPPRPVNPYGNVVVTIRGHGDGAIVSDPEGCGVILFYSEEGEEAQVVDETAPYSFTNVHRGVHAVYIACDRHDGGVAEEIGIVTVRGGGSQQVVELHAALGDTVIDDAEPADDASELNAELNRQRPVNGQG